MGNNTKDHHDRADLTGEHKLGDAGQAILAILFIGVWLSDAFIFKYSTGLNENVSLAVRLPVGIILLILSGYLARASMKIVFGEVRSEPAVIRDRVYKYMRHPMYVSEILLYLGLLLINLSLIAAVIWLLGIIFLYFICRYEEKLLLARFGADYEQYMREVPMWIPGFKNRSIS